MEKVLQELLWVAFFWAPIPLKPYQNTSGCNTWETNWCSHSSSLYIQRYSKMLHDFWPLFPLIIMGGLNMKICQNCVLKICQKFVETNFFPIFVGINLFRGRGYTCINSFILKHPTATKVKSFFYEFIHEVWNHQELFVADILILIKNVL